MKRPLIVCAMALLAAAGVAQVPVHWDYPAQPQLAQLPLAKTEKNASATMTLESTQNKAEPVTSDPRREVSSQTSTATVASPQQSDPVPMADAGVVKPTETPSVPQAVSSRMAQASGLPPPPRNSDVPVPRSDVQTSILQPSPAVPQMQVPVPVTAAKPSGTVSSRRLYPPAVPTVRKASVTPKAQARATLATQKQAAQTPPQIGRLNQAQSLMRLRPTPMRMVSLPPLAYAYAPAPRVSPAARRAPSPRVRVIQ